MSRRYVNEWSEGVLAAWENTSGTLSAEFVMPSGGDPLAHMMTPTAADFPVFGVLQRPSVDDPLVGMKKIAR